MNKIKMIICAALASMALAACSVDDNPIEPVVNLDDPQEQVTDQPAYARPATPPAE